MPQIQQGKNRIQPHPKPKNMKAFQHKLSDPLPELHDHHIFEEREARRDEVECRHEEDSEKARSFRDYEPEQAYGTAHDFQEHTRFGGTREDY